MTRFLFFLLLSGLGFSMKAQLSVDTIIERSLRAYGGSDKFNNIEILYREGVMSLGVSEGESGGSGAEDQVKTWWIPFKGIKTEVTGAQGVLGSVFTPQNAYRYHMANQGGDVDQFENVPSYELKTMLSLYNKLSFLPELCINSYNTARNTKLVGFETVEDQRCFKLQFQDNTIFVNEKTYLPVKLLQFFKDGKYNSKTFVEYYFYDYKPDASGLVLPMRVEQLRKGNDIPIVYQYNLSKVNGDGPREEVLDVKEYQQNHDQYVIKMGDLIRSKHRGKSMQNASRSTEPVKANSAPQDTSQVSH